MKIEELYEDLRIAEEVYDECYTQHRSECALYGDSWPGAQIQLENMRQGIVKLQQRIARLAPQTEPVQFEDIQF